MAETAKPTNWGRRAPLLAFAAVQVYALVFWLNAGRLEWFYLDEWDFLAQRKATNLGDLFRPHNEHWTTIPILVYRCLYFVFGLRDYFPYRLVVVVLYLAAAALIYVVILRAGVHPWIATAAASLFALFGAGWENAIKPFQMTFTGAAVFGLVHLLLADHDGPFDRRDRFGLLAGLIALMMSGIAVTMVFVVGLAVLLRRGWRLALLHVAPLAACYTVWWLAIGHTGKVRQLGAQQPLTVASVFGFVAMGMRGGFSALGHFAGLGAVLALVVVVGLALARSERLKSGRLAELAAPVALLAGAIVFLTTTAIGRASFGSDYARISRYISLTGALVLPALAVAVDAFARRWRVLLPVGMALFLVGIPSNLREVAVAQRPLDVLYSKTKLAILTLPRDSLAAQAPRSLRPEQLTARYVTIGWLLDGVKQHRIPKPPFTILDVVSSANFRLSLFQTNDPAPTTLCTTVHKPVLLTLRKGEVLGIYDNPVSLVPAVLPYLVGFGMVFVPGEGHAVTVLRHVRRVQLSPYDPTRPPRVCTGPGWPQPTPGVDTTTTSTPGG
ncbi:MAG: hypothetical protein ACLPVY_24905 [Acidimicrobiia bacterium]